MAPAAGECIDRFVIEGLLGRGGMGAVYRALDPRLGRRVAIKLLEGLTTDATARARFDREARLIAALDHPAAVHVHEAGESGGTPYIVMELVEGVTLREAARSAASWRVKLGWLVEAASALAAAHDAGLVHRDVKPDNIMVRPDGRVKVLDFGIARRVRYQTGDADARARDDATAEGTIVGTPRYMAPEQLRNETLDGRADEFAWGVTAYEVLAGVSPWSEGNGVEPEDAVSLISRILTTPAPPLAPRAPGLPDEVAAVLMRTLAKDRTARFSTMRAVVEALWPLLGARPAPLSGGDGALAAAPTEEVPTPPVSPGATTPPRFTPEALAPTAAQGLPAVATQTRLAPVPRRPRRWLRVPLALLLVGIVGAWALRRKHPEMAPTVPVASAPEVPTNAVDATAAAPTASRSVSSNPEAARLYAEGNEVWRTDADGGGLMLWERALKLDPDLCEALVRVATLTSGGRGQLVAFEKARRCADRLDDRSQALLTAFAPAFKGPAGQDELLATTKAAADAFPNDPFILYLRAVALTQSEPPAALELLDRITAIDPRFVHAYWLKASLLQQLGHGSEAERTIDACLAVSPGSGLCGLERGNRLRNEGRCREAEAFARETVSLRPSAPFGYLWLAQDLLARAAPREAAERATQQGLQLMPPGVDAGSWTRAKAQLTIELTYGDFAASLPRLDEVDTDPQDVGFGLLFSAAFSAFTRSNALVEIGRREDARKAVRAMLRSSDGYRKIREGETLLALAQAVMFGLEPFSALVDMANKSPDYLPADASPLRRWASLYVWDDPTPEFARQAVAHLPSGWDLESLRALFPGDRYIQRQLGVTLARGGKRTAGIPLMHEGLQGCQLPGEEFSRRHAELELGKALEQQGDNAGARAQYESILRYWGEAKPRSVTADEARRRLAALGPAAPP